MNNIKSEQMEELKKRVEETADETLKMGKPKVDNDESLRDNEHINLQEKLEYKRFDKAIKNISSVQANFDKMNKYKDEKKSLSALAKSMANVVCYDQKTLLRRINNAVQNLNIQSYVKNGNKYREVPYKYWGIVCKLFTLMNSNSFLKEVTKSPKRYKPENITYKIIGEFYTTIREIITDFENKGTQMFYSKTGEPEKIPFYSEKDEDAKIQLDFLKEKKENYLEYESLIKNSILAVNKANDEHVSKTAKELNIFDRENEKEYETITGFEVDFANYMATPSITHDYDNLVFKFNEFNKELSVLLGSFIPIVKSDLGNKFIEYVDLLCGFEENQLEYFLEILFDLSVRVDKLNDFKNKFDEKTKDLDKSKRQKILNRLKTIIKNCG